ESKQEEIVIKDANPRDFDELLKKMYGASTEPFTVENAIRYMMMVDMFDLQIAREQVENWLLYTDLVSIHRKFLIAYHHNLKLLKNDIVHQFKEKAADHTNRAGYYRSFREFLEESPEWAEFPLSVRVPLLLGNPCDLLK
ncbi:hypothetical protein PENTCL1PPCAC_13167, partial [Pristionchus entomophagus]